jgi:thiol-disulfide isomerase/thioredoxin
MHVVIPWELIGSAVVAALLAAWWGARRAARAGLPRSAPADLALTVALAAIVGARAVAVAVDVALSGVLPGWRSLLTLGAGLSTPGGLVGGLVAGWWLLRRDRFEAAVWRAAVPAAAAGLALWSLLALVRGDAAGITAPPPLGWPLPGEDTARVPVALLEALGYALFAVLVARSDRFAALSPARLAALLAVWVAALHLMGAALRPAAPTADADLDMLLGLLVLLVAGVLARGRTGRRARLVSGGAALAAAALVGVAALGSGAPEGLDAAAATAAPGLEHAVTADGPAAAPPPAWGPDELAAFAAAADGPVVVNFWGSWCPPCHAEAPALARVARAYAGDVAFLGVLVNDDPVRAAGFARRYDLPFPSVADGGLRNPLGAVGVPTTVVLRPDGTVAARVVGGLDARGLARAIDRAGG